MDNNNTPRNKSLDDALQESDAVRVSQNQIFQRGVDSRSGNTVVRDTSNERVFLGSQLSGGVSFYGLKVSKPGFDAETATDSQLIFNSSQNIFKIIASSTVTLTPSNTGSPNFTVSAGGYSTTAAVPNPTANVPAAIVYFKFPFPLTSGGRTLYSGNWQGMPLFAATSSAGTTTSIANIFYDITATTLTFYYNQFINVDFGVSPDIQFRYYMLQETVN